MINFFRNKFFVGVSIIFLGVIGFFIFQRISNEQPVVKGEKSYLVKKQIIKEILSLSGNIDADEKITLRFQSSGMLTWVGVKEGDYVKKYQGVASLDQKELQKNLQKYLNTYMKTRWDFETTKDENDIKNIGGLTTDLREAAVRTLDKAQFDLNNSVLDVELKDIALKYSYLYTPIEGIVTKVSLPYAGVNATPAQAEFEIVNPKTIYLYATADQTDVIKIKEKMQGNITLDSYPDDQISGEVMNIAFTPDTDESGTVYGVKIKINESEIENKYRLGMTGDIEFEIGKGRNVLMIPTSFIKIEKSEKYVNKVVKGKKIKTVIKTGEIEDSMTEVISGLNENETIVN